MASATLTPFPDLFLERHGSDRQAPIHHHIFTTPQLPREILIVTWALVLKGYTARDEVAFIVDDDVVSVNTLTWTTESRGSLDDVERTRGFTAISIQEGVDASSEASKPELRDDGTSVHIYYSTASGRLDLKVQRVCIQEYLSLLSQQIQLAIVKACELEDYFRPGAQDECGQDANRLSIINEHPQILSGPQILHDLAHSRCRNEDTALEFLGAEDEVQTLTYKILFERVLKVSQRLSALLKARQVSSTGHVVIPVLLPQSPELYIALLAVLEAGAAFCPLALDMPEERVRFITEDVGASVLITTSSLVAKLPDDLGSKVAVCLLDQDDNDLSGHEEDAPLRIPSPADIAYVMYSKSVERKPCFHVCPVF